MEELVFFAFKIYWCILLNQQGYNQNFKFEKTRFGNLKKLWQLVEIQDFAATRETTEKG